MSDVAVEFLKRVIFPITVLLGAMVALGLLITKVMFDRGALEVGRLTGARA